MNPNDESWPPIPTEIERQRRPINEAMVSPIPLGVVSCLLSSLLFGANAFFLWRLHQMSFQDKVGFVVLHNNISGMLQGAEIVGIPIALLLGILSWKTKIGKLGLLISVSFLLVVLCTYLFGLPYDLVFRR